jgi:hypothetical protein
MLLLLLEEGLRFGFALASRQLFACCKSLLDVENGE